MCVSFEGARLRCFCWRSLVAVLGSGGLRVGWDEGLACDIGLTGGIWVWVEHGLFLGMNTSHPKLLLREGRVRALRV